MIKKMIKKWITEVMSETPVEVDYDELATCVDMSDCKVDYDELAAHVCMDNLSGHLDISDLAEYVSVSDVAYEMDKDLHSLSRQIDHQQIVIDYDKVMTKGDDSVKAILNALSNFELAITEMRMTLQTEE